LCELFEIVVATLQIPTSSKHCNTVCLNCVLLETHWHTQFVWTSMKCLLSVHGFIWASVMAD